MKPIVLSAVAGLALGASSVASADVIYQVENLAAGSSHEFFNNSAGTETEDNWVANSFQITAGGTHVTQIQFLCGSSNGLANPPPFSNVPITAALYTGSSLTNPDAGSGLSRIVASTD